MEYAFTADPPSAAGGAVPGLLLGSGQGRLTIEGKPAGEGRITAFGAFGGETFDVGADFGSPVGDDAYQTPFAFNGVVEKITLTLHSK